MADASELRFGRLGQGLGDFEENLRFGDTFIWDLTESNPTDEDCAFCDQPDPEIAISPFDIAIPLASGRAALYDTNLDKPGDAAARSDACMLESRKRIKG